MKNILFIILSFTLIIGMTACSKNSEKQNNTNNTQGEEEKIESELKGTWELSNSTINFGEELTFNNGKVACKSYVSSTKNNPSESSGEYSISNNQIIVEINGHVTSFDYSYENDELILSRKIEEGADAGETRIYKKIS